MNKRKLIFILIVVFTFNISARAQDKYYTLLFKKGDIYTAYNAPGFDRLVFKFLEQPKCTDKYILKAIALDANNKRVAPPVILDKINNNPSLRVNDLFQGILILTKDEMTTNGMTGTSDCYFEPQEYVVDADTYVNYEVTDMFNSHALISFHIDPSPPARPK